MLKEYNVVIKKCIRTDYYNAIYKDTKIIVNIKTGYVNASKLASNNGRFFAYWKRLKKSNTYINNVSKKLNISEEKLFFSINGRAYANITGTYIHPYILSTYFEWTFSTKNTNKNNYFYLITSKYYLAVKAGFWRSDIDTLKKRYKTVLGNSVKIFYVEVNDTRKFEKQFAKKFKKYNISNELYELEYFSEYKDYLIDNQNESEVESESDED